MTTILNLISEFWYVVSDFFETFFSSSLRPFAAALFTLLFFIPAFCGVLRRIF